MRWHKLAVKLQPFPQRPSYRDGVQLLCGGDHLPLILHLEKSVLPAEFLGKESVHLDNEDFVGGSPHLPLTRWSSLQAPSQGVNH